MANSVVVTPPKAAWQMVCRAKDEGGLGVLNLATQSEALLLKFSTISSTKQTSLGSLSLGKALHKW